MNTGVSLVRHVLKQRIGPSNFLACKSGAREAAPIDGAPASLGSIGPREAFTRTHKFTHVFPTRAWLGHRGRFFPRWPMHCAPSPAPATSANRASPGGVAREAERKFCGNEDSENVGPTYPAPRCVGLSPQSRTQSRHEALSAHLSSRDVRIEPRVSSRRTATRSVVARRGFLFTQHQ